MAHAFIVTPSNEELKDPATWKSEKGRKSIVRYVLLIEKEIGEDKKGKVVSTQYRIPGDKFVQTNKIRSLVKKTTELEQTFTKTFSTEMTKEITAQLDGTISLVSLATVLGAKMQYQNAKKITDTIQDVLRKKESFTWEIETEQSNAVEQQTQEEKDSVAYTTYYLLREHIWRVYLVRADYLSFKYKGYLLNWFDTKTGMKPDFDDVIKPIYRIRFYEPYPELSYTNKRHKTEIEDEKEIIIKHFNGPVSSRRCPYLPSLESLAVIAFPVGQDERTIARKHKSAKKATPKKAAKKAAPKKAAKKAAPKKAAKKAAPKKAAKKAAKKK